MTKHCMAPWTSSIALVKLMSMFCFGSVAGFSVCSSFTKSIIAPSGQKSFGRWTMYDSPGDPPNNNVWNVLSQTERWISQTLDAATTAPSTNKMTGNTNNPYARKEVSYMCETSRESVMVVAGLFRRLRKLRQLGESHGAAEEARRLEMDDDSSYDPTTFRQTHVLVIPFHQKFQKEFHTFDRMVEAVNQARRNARDYVTDISLEKLDDRMHREEHDEEEEERDWVVSVNCAHLHPTYGEKTPQQVLQELRDEAEQGEVDLNLLEYREKRELARRSPYPTAVLEVRATPPPRDYYGSPVDRQQQQQQKSREASSSSDDGGVSRQDIQKLEALFGRSAYMQRQQQNSDAHPEDAFYDFIGQSLNEVSVVTPMSMAQTWVSQNDPDFDSETCAFTSTRTKHVDQAMEFLFANLAMQVHQFCDHASKTTIGAARRHYLVMPNFVSSSATSFEKFVHDAKKILAVLPEYAAVGDNPPALPVEIITLHPEHILRNRQSPVPICILQWKEEAGGGNKEQQENDNTGSDV